MAPPLMIQGWGLEVRGGGGGSDQDPVCGDRLHARQPLCPSHVYLAVFQPIVAPGGSLAPPGRPRDSPAPSGTAEVPFAICEHLRPEHPRKHLQINSTTCCQVATGGAVRGGLKKKIEGTTMSLEKEICNPRCTLYCLIQQSSTLEWSSTTVVK